MAEASASLIHELRRLVGRAWVSSDADAVLVGLYVDEHAEDAFAALVHRHGPMVLRVCRRVIGDVHLAEDAFQATFLLLARKARTIRRRHSVAAWLFGVALRVARKARRGTGVPTVAESALDRIDPHADPLSQLMAREMLAVLHEEIQRLPEVYRSPLILCTLEGLSQKEAARWLGWSEGSVRGRLDRARERLRVRLVRRGVALSAAMAFWEATRGAVRAGLTVRLVNHTVEAGLAYAGYQATAFAAASPEVVKLAGAALKGAAFLKWKLGLIAVLFMGLTTIGVAKFVPWASDSNGVQKGDKRLAAPLQEAGQKDDKPKVDLYGDPLPTGVLARLGTVRFRHEGYARDLVFSADAKILGGSTQSGLIVWDATTGREIRRLPRVSHGPAGNTIDVSSDGRVLAVTLPTYGKVGLWEIASGKDLCVLEAPASKDPDLSLEKVVRFAADGKTLAFSYNKKLHVFDVATGQLLTSVGDIQSIRSLDFSPDGKTLALTAFGPIAQLWDIATGKMTFGLHDPDMNFAISIAFSPDGNTFAVCQWDRISLYETKSGKALSRFIDPKMQSNSLRFSPDGKTLVSGGQDGHIRVWEVATGKVVHTFNSRIGGESVAFSASCKTAAIGNGSTVRLWDIPTGKELFTEFQGHDSLVWQLAFAPGGKSLFSSEIQWQIRQWNTATWKPTNVLPGGASTLSVSPDGKRLAWARAFSGETVRILDLTNNKEDRTIKVPDTKDVGSVVFSADGLKLFTLDVSSVKQANWGSHRLRQWDLATGKQEQDRAFAQQMYEPFIAANGKAVIAGKNDGIQIQDIELGRERLFKSPKNVGMTPLAASRDGRLLATADNGEDASLRIWEMATGHEVFSWKGHDSVAAWSIDNLFIASASTTYSKLRIADTTVRLWNAVNGEELVQFDGLSASVHGLAISPDNAYLAAGMQDSTILIWDISQAVRKGKLRAIELKTQELESCWSALAGDDAAKAHRAAWTLIAAGPQSVPFLQKLLTPVAVADAGKIQQWIADLDSERFAVRQAAAKELVNVGEQVKASVEKVLEGNITLETRRRLEQVIKELPDVPGSETLRTMRAIMVLEKIGTTDARAILVALAKGAPAARETREAQAALMRLDIERSRPRR